LPLNFEMVFLVSQYRALVMAKAMKKYIFLLNGSISKEVKIKLILKIQRTKSSLYSVI